jgi:hypothetical protein
MLKFKHTILLFFFLLGGVFFFGCKINKGKPAIKKEKMTEILADIYRTQSIMNVSTLPDSVKKAYYYCHVLERHGVTEELFDSAVAWYARNMDIFEEVYVEVIAQLEKEKAALE